MAILTIHTGPVPRQEIFSTGRQFSILALCKYSRQNPRPVCTGQCRSPILVSAGSHAPQCRTSYCPVCLPDTDQYMEGTLPVGCAPRVSIEPHTVQYACLTSPVYCGPLSSVRKAHVQCRSPILVSAGSHAPQCRTSYCPVCLPVTPLSSIGPSSFQGAVSLESDHRYRLAYMAWSVRRVPASGS